MCFVKQHNASLNYSIWTQQSFRSKWKFNRKYFWNTGQLTRNTEQALRIQCHKIVTNQPTNRKGTDKQPHNAGKAQKPKRQGFTTLITHQQPGAIYMHSVTPKKWISAILPYYTLTFFSICNLMTDSCSEFRSYYYENWQKEKLTWNVSNL